MPPVRTPGWLLTLLLAACSAPMDTAAGSTDGAQDTRDDAGRAAQDGGGKPSVRALSPVRKLSTETKHTLKARETISELARARYGSRHYSRLIVLFNDFRDPSKLSIGTTVELPELGEILSASGATAVAGDQLAQLLDVRERWLTIEPSVGQAFERATDTAPGADIEAEIVLEDAPSVAGVAAAGTQNPAQAATTVKDPFATQSDIPGQSDGPSRPSSSASRNAVAGGVSEPVRQRFAPLSVSLEADLIQALGPMATDLETAADALDALDDETVRPPKKTAQELRNAARLMRLLVAGEPPGNFDLDDVHQHLANAMINAVLWGRKGYR